MKIVTYLPTGEVRSFEVPDGTRIEIIPGGEDPFPSYKYLNRYDDGPDKPSNGAPKEKEWLKNGQK